MRFTFLALLAALATPAVADPLPKEWQVRREAMNQLGDRTCAGDHIAYNKLRDGVKNGDAVAIHELNWIYTNCKTGETREWMALASVSYLVTAAEMGYPISQSNLGFCQIRGDCDGIPRDKETGIYFLHAAIVGGYGETAYHLGMQLTVGPHMDQDLKLATMMLNIAKLEDVPASMTDKLAAALYQATEGKPLTSPELELSPKEQRALFVEEGYSMLRKNIYSSYGGLDSPFTFFEQMDDETQKLIFGD
ncbi:sel1 repeat family protein [Celeribacter ethanolicus]|uniref:sel1 repeat family protein n=1 Tax=Celeribacter ethanolicus TaxID=1758178 RepID=UPI00083641D8|nr:sel1 repeat family protein [Celeribacter ethanolicus]